MAEFQYFPSLFWHHTQMIRDKKYCPSDVWIPNSQRIAVLAALWENGQWTRVQEAFVRQLSGVPYSTKTKLAFQNKFLKENQNKFIDAIQDYLREQSKPVWSIMPDFCHLKVLSWLLTVGWRVEVRFGMVL